MRKIGKKNKLLPKGMTPGFKKIRKDGSIATSNKGGVGISIEKMDESADTVMRLMKDIQQSRIDPRDLSPKQRRMCLMLVVNGKSTSNDLAAIFKVSPKTIRQDIRILRQEVGREVKEWGVEEVIGQISMSAEKFTALALKQEDIGLAWAIQRDFAKMMKDFGVIGEDKKDNSFKITIEGIGEGYNRATDVLYGALDPTLTGEVIEVKPNKIEQAKPPQLPVPNRFPDEPEADPQIEIEVKPETDGNEGPKVFGYTKR